MSEEKLTFWDENKHFFVIMVVAALCNMAVGLTVYYTYDYVWSMNQCGELLNQTWTYRGIK